MPSSTPTLGNLGRVWTRIAATAAVVTLALTALAPSAAQAKHDNKPSCVKVWRVGGLVKRTVYAKNNCSSTKSFIVNKKGRDSSCISVSPGETESHTFSKLTAYHGTTWGC